MTQPICEWCDGDGRISCDADCAECNGMGCLCVYCEGTGLEQGDETHIWSNPPADAGKPDPALHRPAWCVVCLKWEELP